MWKLFLFVLVLLSIGADAGVVSGTACGLCWHAYRAAWRNVVMSGAHAYVPWGPPASGLGLLAMYGSCVSICATAVNPVV